MLLPIPIYWIGLIACGIQGYDNTSGNKHLLPSSVLLASFGGGILRDTIWLRQSPVFLNLETIPEIILALFGSALRALFGKTVLFQLFFSAADYFGVGTFIIIGISTAQQNHCSPFIVFLCGITTALGGGIWSRIECGHSLPDLLSQNVAYRVIVVLSSGLYMAWLNIGIPPLEAQILLVLVTGFSNIMLSKWFRNVLKNFIRQQQVFSLNIMEQVYFALWQKEMCAPYRAPKSAFCPKPRFLYHPLPFA